MRALGGAVHQLPATASRPQAVQRGGLASCSAPAPISPARPSAVAAAQRSSRQRACGAPSPCCAASACGGPLGSSRLQRQRRDDSLPGSGGSAWRCAAAAGSEPGGPAPPAADDGEGPWSREDLERMVEEQQQEEQEALGGTWREHFEDDPESLFDYTERAYEEFGAALDYVSSISDPELQMIAANKYKLPMSIVSESMGMGSWKLNGSIDPAIELLVTRIESTWRELLHDDLNLYPPEKWKDQGWDWCDSMDPERELDGFAHADVPDPEPGEDGYPRLFLENRIYCSRVFRKLHIEVGWRQDGLHILHVVLYPRYKYDLPILALDLVVAPGGRVSLAIIDACPVSRNKMLPQHYMQTMHELQQLLLTDPANQRDVPKWGKATFSPLCVCMTPKDGEELAGFMKYVIALHRAHMMLSTLMQPLEPVDKRISAKAQEVLDGHKRFVDNMLDNKKTSRVLEVAFGKEWAKSYMTEVMFDFTPEYDPPYADGSIFKLYDYFDEHPELGDLPEMALQMQDSIDQERAQEYLDDLLMSPEFAAPASRRGGKDEAEEEEAGPGSLSDVNSITRKRSEWALSRLYETDDAFRASVDELVPDAGLLLLQGKLGGVLADQLKGALGRGMEGVPAPAPTPVSAPATTPAPGTATGTTPKAPGGGDKAKN